MLFRSTTGRFALLVFDEFHHEDEERHLFQHRIRGAIQGIMRRGELEHSEIIQLGDEIGKVIIPYIRSKPFLMENFWQHELSFKGQSYFALVHKSINRRFGPPSGFNYYLAERLN